MKNLITILCAGGLITLLTIQNTYYIIQPIKITQSQSVNPVTILLRELNCPKERVENIAKAIELASNETKINPFLLTVLMFTESNFDPYAKSSKNYKGLLQTPTATNKFTDVDVLHGARILQEKLRLADGNLLLALSLYKGGRNSIARKQAIQCLNLYRKVMTKG